MDLEESRKKEKEAAKNEVHEAAGGLSFSRVADLNRSSILFASPHQIAMRSCPFVHSPRWTDASSHKPAAGLKALRHGAASTTLLSAALVGKSLQRVLDVYVWACSMDVDLSEQLRPRQQDPLTACRFLRRLHLVRPQLYPPECTWPPGLQLAFQECAHL